MGLALTATVADALRKHQASLYYRLSTMLTGSLAREAGAGERRGRASAPASLPWLLRRVNQQYRSAIRQSLEVVGVGELPQPGYWALMVLVRGGTDAGDLMDEMGVSKQAVSKLVETLVGAGFVARKPNASDRRRSDLSLTAKGRKAARVIGKSVRRTEESFANELGSKPFADLVQMLARLARHDT